MLRSMLSSHNRWLFARIAPAAVTVTLLAAPANVSAQATRVEPSKGQANNSSPRVAAPSPQAGVYSATQAARGDKVFSANCITCHARKDMSNDDFRLKWNGRTVHDLFERLRTTMPESDPGALSNGEYLDVVAYLLKLNGVPEGKTAMVAGPALKQHKLTLPGGK